MNVTGLTGTIRPRLCLVKDGCANLALDMRLLPLLLLLLLAFPPAIYADEPEELGPATLRVNVCTRVESSPARYALVAVHPSELGPYIARGDRVYVTSSECPNQTVFFVPQDQPTRRAVPVEIGPLEQVSPVGGGQGRLPGSDPDVPRWGIPVEAEPLPDESAGGGQGQVPTNDEATRRAVPVELYPIDAPASTPNGGGQGRLPEDDAWRQAIPVEAVPLPMGEDLASLYRRQ